jgi:hypothetical protein
MTNVSTRAQVNEASAKFDKSQVRHVPQQKKFALPLPDGGIIRILLAFLILYRFIFVFLSKAQLSKSLPNDSRS